MLAVVALLLAALAFTAPAHAAPTTMAKLDSFASQLAGEPLQVACDEPASDSRSGSATFDGWVHLQPWACYRLLHPRSSATELGIAAELLAHETQHDRWRTYDEGDAECWAITVVPRLIAAYRLPRAFAARVSASAYAFHAELPAEFRTHC